jgi:hypothetical protein
MMVASLGDSKNSRSLLQQYTEALWHLGKKKQDKHQEMLEYYESVVRNANLEAHVERDKDGNERVAVSGLEGLL